MRAPWRTFPGRDPLAWRVPCGDTRPVRGRAPGTEASWVGEAELPGAPPAPTVCARSCPQLDGSAPREPHPPPPTLMLCRAPGCPPRYPLWQGAKPSGPAARTRAVAMVPVLETRGFQPIAQMALLRAQSPRLSQRGGGWGDPVGGESDPGGVPWVSRKSGDGCPGFHPSTQL